MFLNALSKTNIVLITVMAMAYLRTCKEKVESLYGIYFLVDDRNRTKLVLRAII